MVTGVYQDKLCKALEKAPPKTYLEAMAALLKWIEGVELLLESEPFQVTDTGTMEEQGLHYRVGNPYYYTSRMQISTSIFKI